MPLLHNCQISNFKLNLTNGIIMAKIIAYWHRNVMGMIIQTRIFELCNGRYHNLSDLARAMGLSISQVYRVREGRRSINHKFIIGAKRAFPEQGLDELFYLVDKGTTVT
jgi:hypothetical protein